MYTYKPTVVHTLSTLDTRDKPYVFAIVSFLQKVTLANYLFTCTCTNDTCYMHVRMYSCCSLAPRPPSFIRLPKAGKPGDKATLAGSARPHPQGVNVVLKEACSPQAYTGTVTLDPIASV